MSSNVSTVKEKLCSLKFRWRKRFFQISERIFVEPILYGNTAEILTTKKESNRHTHKWKLYVRSFDDERFSKIVDRVEFRLHETFQNNVRSSLHFFTRNKYFLFFQRSVRFRLKSMKPVGVNSKLLSQFSSLIQTKNRFDLNFSSKFVSQL